MRRENDVKDHVKAGDQIKKENARDQIKKQQIFEKHGDSTAADEEMRDVGQSLKDKFVTEDIDDLFGTPQDLEIVEKDIPERLQIKLAGRLNPADAEIETESEWIFNIIIDSLEQSKEQSFASKIQEVKKKICKVLKFFRCESLDIPFITKYRQNELIPELTPNDVWKIFSLDIEYGKFQVQKK